MKLARQYFLHVLLELGKISLVMINAKWLFWVTYRKYQGIWTCLLNYIYSKTINKSNKERRKKNKEKGTCKWDYFSNFEGIKIPNNFLKCGLNASATLDK